MNKEKDNSLMKYNDSKVEASSHKLESDSK